MYVQSMYDQMNHITLSFPQLSSCREVSSWRK